MKKKSLFLLGSIVAFSALVGGTFAAWAVTDNADPLNIKVSTGSIDTDTTTKYITLSYGQSQSIGNVANLQAGKIHKAGVLDLRVTTSDSTAAGGKLELAVTDSKGTGLAADLVVKVYAGDLTATAGIIDANTVKDLTPLTFTNGVATLSSLASGSEHLYTVTVELKAGITATELTALDGVVANIEMDWNHNIDDKDLVTTTTLYAHGFTGTTYVYAFKGAKQNAAWPGIAMTAATREGYFVAEVSNEFDTVVFNNNNGQQSSDLVIATAFASGNLFNYNAEHPEQSTVSTYADLATPDYYLVGEEFGNWVVGTGAIHLTNPVNGVYSVEITTTKADSKLKIYDSVNDVWYGELGTSSGDFNIGIAGKYTITFKPSAAGTQQDPVIHCEQVPAQQNNG